MQLFQVGDVVVHLGSKNHQGRVLDAWHDGLEWRYYVQHSGFTWSVPQPSLKRAKPSRQRPS